MPSYSYYAKKKLVNIAIAALSSRQPSYTKCTKSNIQSSCNIQSVSNAKYTRLIILYNRLVPYLIYYRVLGLI